MKGLLSHVTRLAAAHAGASRFAAAVAVCICAAGLLIAATPTGPKKISELTVTNALNDNTLLEFSAPNGTGWVTRAAPKHILFSNVTARGTWNFPGTANHSQANLTNARALGRMQFDEALVNSNAPTGTKTQWVASFGDFPRWRQTVSSNVLSVIDSQNGDVHLQLDQNKRVSVLGGGMLVNSGTSQATNLFSFVSQGLIRGNGGFQAASGNVGGSTTTGGLLFDNGLYISGSASNSTAAGAAYVSKSNLVSGVRNITPTGYSVTGTEFVALTRITDSTNRFTSLAYAITNSTIMVYSPNGVGGTDTSDVSSFEYEIYTTAISGGVPVAATSIASNSGFGFNITLLGNTTASNITASGTVMAQDFKSGDGSIGGTANTGGGVFKDGLYISGTLYSDPGYTFTGSGPIVLETSAYVIDMNLTTPTIISPTFSGSFTLGSQLHLNSTSASPPDEGLNIALHHDGILNFSLYTNGSALFAGTVQAGGLTNNGIAHIPTNAAPFTVITNGVDGGGSYISGTVLTNGAARAFVTFKYGLTISAAQGLSQTTQLWAQDNGSGTYKLVAAAKLERSATITGYELVEGQLCAFVDPGSRYYVTNSSLGAVVSRPLVKHF